MTTPIRPQVRSDLAVVVLDGEAVVYDEEENALHHLNPTATLIFQLLDGSASLRELSEELGEAYSQPSEAIEPEVRSAYRYFRRLGLLTGSAEAIPATR